MPWSYTFGKTEAVDFILKHTNVNSKILDVGPGVGTYADYLQPYGYRLDALEIYEKYIQVYKLKEKYRNVYVGNIVEWNVEGYDFVILGDVLEHLSIEEAKIVISKCKNTLIAVPYLCPQSGVDFYHEETRLINPYEEHKQSDLTPLVMLTRYPCLKLIWSNHLYGYYTNIQDY